MSEPNIFGLDKWSKRSDNVQCPTVISNTACMLCTHTKIRTHNPNSVPHVYVPVNALRNPPGMTIMGIRVALANSLNSRLGKLTLNDGDVKLREFSLLDWTTVLQDGRGLCEGLHTPTQALRASLLVSPKLLLTTTFSLFFKGASGEGRDWSCCTNPVLVSNSVLSSRDSAGVSCS